VDEPRPVSGAELQPGIRYFDLTRANDSLFQALLPQLTSARGLVLDLRGYPRVQPRSLRHLVGDTTRWGGRQMSIPTVLRPDRENMTFSFVNPWVIPPAVPRITGSIVFLTDERAGSYGESLLDLIEEHRLGVIVGSPSAGTNGSNNPFLVPGGYRVSFTGMRVVRHDGSRLHGVGVVPAVRVSPTIAGIRAGRDEVLEKGLEVLGRGAR
jgi:C-terminal processing protease CtpA/Prc